MSTEATSETKAVDESTSHHFVVYTDGGCRPSRGFGGYGFHGYLFQEEKPKQGAGARATPTADGYSDNKAEAVTVHKYVDLWSSIVGLTTNNVAELLAACEALEYSDDKDVKSVRMFVDSTYVRDGLTDWVVGWMANDWKKSNGEDVSNRDLWERLIRAKASLEQKVVDVKIEWVKGHSGDLGNSQADLLATRGVILSKKGMDERRLINRTPKATGTSRPNTTACSRKAIGISTPMRKALSSATTAGMCIILVSTVITIICWVSGCPTPVSRSCTPKSRRKP